jgi:general secretion pathway protein H
VKSRGFSLIELMIVLILISLSISLVAPSLSRFSKNIELKAAAKKISAILRYYRNEAVHRGRVQQVLFDANAREVRIQAVAEEKGMGEEETPSRSEAPKYPLPAGIQIKEIKIPASQYPTEFPTIEFYPDGGSNGGSIVLENEGNKGYKIKVHFLTGIVRIENA